MGNGNLRPLVVASSTEHRNVQVRCWRIEIAARENRVMLMAGHTAWSKGVSPRRRPPMKASGVFSGLPFVASAADGNFLLFPLRRLHSVARVARQV